MTQLVPLYLRAESEDAMIAALPAYMRSTNEMGAGIWAVAGVNPRFGLCVLGAVVMEPAEIDPHTMAVTVPAVFDNRFHLNVLVDAQALSDVPPEIILDPAPATPAVKFAGVE